MRVRWLEVSLTVDGELAEAVADVLARYAPRGVVIEHEADAPPDAVRVFAYLPVDEQIEMRRRQVEEALWYLGRIRPLPAPTFTPLDDRNWMEAWKEHFHPIPIGERLIVLPPWLDSPDPERIQVKIDPGMAFGTGTHPSTQLTLELMEMCFNTRSPHEVIDVGCGSGILSIAARKLGARRVLGVDVDAAAVMASRHNAAANGIEEGVTFEVGSVAEIRAGSFPLRRAPLVLANILAPVLLRLLEDGLGDLVAPGGGLILSGILQEQEEALLEAAQARGLARGEQRRREDWVAWLLHRPEA